MAETAGDCRVDQTGLENSPVHETPSVSGTTMEQWQCPHCDHCLRFRSEHRDTARLAASSHMKRQHGLEFVAEFFCGRNGVEGRLPLSSSTEDRRRLIAGRCRR